ncbi:MAG: methane monooxygenase/ammonia monooxygenase subunit B [candidate division NC10 bacterium]|nr:methane monooxygenase/ammonia monooxygenase subunit B [candidate division NC10 bacterium]MDE2322255.1 methane monooxygenase/ammonia monooxygenase subunit B [candidate division NC10 bacterium]
MRIGRAALSAIVIGSIAVSAGTAWAHGERSQEPFMRMRTITFYDTNWSKTRVKPGETMELSGKFHAFSEWPRAVYHPDSIFLHFSVPGPSMLKKEAWMNGMPVINSTKAKLGGDYDYKEVIMGRVTGTYHVHPMVNIEGGGPLVGGGQFVTVDGDWSNFTNNVTTISGETIDMERFGLGRVVGWWALWAFIGIFWLVWWVRRPFVRRLFQVGVVPEEDLVSPGDKTVGLVLMVATVLIVAIGYVTTNGAYPITIPLQTGRMDTPDLKATTAFTPYAQATVKVRPITAVYTVPGRSLGMVLEVTNGSSRPQQLGGFITANLQFRDPALFPDSRLKIKVEPAGPINPGQTATLSVDATDAEWEYQRLAELIYDSDSRYGGLAEFFDADKNRQIVEVGGPVIPSFEGGATALSGGGKWRPTTQYK